MIKSLAFTLSSSTFFLGGGEGEGEAQIIGLWWDVKKIGWKVKEPSSSFTLLPLTHADIFLRTMDPIYQTQQGRKRIKIYSSAAESV